MGKLWSSENLEKAGEAAQGALAGWLGDDEEPVQVTVESVDYTVPIIAGAALVAVVLFVAMRR